ncbi:hypothetical protein D9598_11330 [Roseomonas sp. KE0001]|nr:hypothetical protein [Roseomonas sp. KE0001]
MPGHVPAELSPRPAGAGGRPGPACGPGERRGAEGGRPGGGGGDFHPRRAPRRPGPPRDSRGGDEPSGHRHALCRLPRRGWRGRPARGRAPAACARLVRPVPPGAGAPRL